ncbi:hypothetical protein ABNX05_21710 [Lysinibacillus sp. M3]|uniref:Uncharacterized protein n=1 Tax=Lysinibacillus zambalensis TaxID=3160866 RepID=A0ABV1MXL9_9BACI
MSFYLLICILPFTLVTLLYIINIIFLSKKTLNNIKMWKTSILVVNAIALCLSTLIVLPYIVLLTIFSLGTGDEFNTEDDFNLEAATLILLSIFSFLYFFVTNIVFTVFTAKKQFHQG